MPADICYEFYIATYDRGEHWQTGKAKPYHWAFFIKTESNSGEVHQLRGMPGAFYYKGAEKDINPNIDPDNSGHFLQKVEIGTVSGGALKAFGEACAGVTIDSSESSGWNCQSWSLEALNKIREVRGVDIWYGNAAIKEWLKEKESG